MSNFDERKKEFQRQQDRLKMMSPDTERKSGLMSADAMIDSLLQKSDTFRKNSDLPTWLQVNSPLCCPFYEKIWEIVKANDSVVDTPRVSQLLLTSGLHPDILGFIWNLANKTSPGQLTKQELFVVLALVGLAQTGCTFSNLSVLSLVPSAPMPRLHVPFQPVFNRPQPTLLSSPTVPAPHLPPSTPVSLIRHPSSGANNSSPVVEDDFADFQSADVFETSVVQPSVKLSSFIKVSPESERKLRNLPESLAALPESKISSKNQVSSVTSVLSSSVGSRLANHSLQDKPRKCFLPSTFLLKETKIPSIELDENTRKIEIPSVGTFRETVLPVKKNEETLLSLEEDKYGALRDLETKVEEDFGDFLSADLPSERAVEAWNTWNQSVHETPTKVAETSQSVDLLGDCFDLSFKSPEDFGDSSTPDFSRRESWSSLDKPNHTVGEKCLSCCQDLLTEGLLLLKNLDSTVLDEILGTEKAQNYLESLRVVYFIAKRVNSADSYFNDRFLEIQTLWEQISLIIPESPKTTEKDEELTENCPPCTVCRVTTSKTDLEIDGKRFHPSCANLWVNFIESTLPCT